MSFGELKAHLDHLTILFFIEAFYFTRHIIYNDLGNSEYENGMHYTFINAKLVN